MKNKLCCINEFKNKVKRKLRLKPKQASHRVAYTEHECQFTMGLAQQIDDLESLGLLKR